jgi:hypothetical protein
MATTRRSFLRNLFAATVAALGTTLSGSRARAAPKPAPARPSKRIWIGHY